MKVVILAGGYGTRISEESKFKPKPMIEIGGMPILWHIMKEYSYYGFNDFVICAGYKQHMIKEWFADYFLHTSDVTFDFTQGNEMIVHDQHAEPWRVTVVDTGLNTMTGGRIKRVQKYIGNETFMMTYGDGVCDVNIAELVKFHKQHGKLATLTAVVQEQQKGVLDIGQDNSVQAFREKSVNDGAIINAGYMVLEPEVFDTISGDDTIFEQAPLRELAAQRPADELRAPRILAVHGYRARKKYAGKNVGVRLCALGSVEPTMNLEFYRGKRVFVTGHTGFKGSWLCRMLVGAGAVVTGLQFAAAHNPQSVHPGWVGRQNDQRDRRHPRFCQPESSL